MDYDYFPINKYSKWYISLMETRKFQPRDKCVTEKHHIFPVSIFGKNTFTVNLTHREHYIAHLLLWKMFDPDSTEYYKMLYAFKSMCELSSRDNKRGQRVINSTLYEKYRSEVRRLNSIQTKRRWDTNTEYREKQTQHNQEYWKDEAHRREQSVRRKEYYESNPEAKEITGSHFKEFYKDPEQKERCKRKLSKQKATGDFEAKRKAGVEAVRSQIVESFKNTVAQMSIEERKQKFARPKTEQQLRDHANKLKGRRRKINTVTLETKLAVNGELLEMPWVWYNEAPESVLQNRKQQLAIKRTVSTP